MSRSLINSILAVGMITLVTGCSTMSGGSMASSLSPSNLNPFSKFNSSFSGHTEPAIEEDVSFMERDYEEHQTASTKPDDSEISFSDDDLDFNE
ncbi:MAG: hypothetical protein R3C11_16575 [Planctomycetaceae bacterium]